MRRHAKNLFVVGLVVSLFLHFGTGLVVYLKESRVKKSQPIEFTIIDQKKMAEFERLQKLPNNAKQIVEQDEHRINDEIDPKAKYLSRYNQKVVNETKAANNGKFQNDAKQGQTAKTTEQHDLKEKQKQAQNSKKVIEKQKNILTSEEGDVSLPKITALKPQFQWDKVQVGVPNPGPLSQTDDHLKDIQTGPQTLLSSREFIYYSYYSRIKERIRLFWEPKIKEKVTRLFMSGRHLASNEEKITRLVITLDNQGRLLRVQVLGESGLKDLDDAAVEAFQQAAPFPNPPKGIVEADGTIKINWDFILEANNSSFFQKHKSFAAN